MAGISRAYKRRGNMVANTGAPVMCLDAGSRLSYPTSGTTWTDLSGNGNTGTLVNGPTYSSANGGAIVFDGVNDYGSTPLSLGGYTAFTISAWIKTTTALKEVASTYGAGNVFEFWIDTSKKINVFAYGATIAYRISNAVVGTGNWVYCTGTYQGSSGALNTYVNGVIDNGTLVGTVPTALTSTGSTVVIGNVNLGSFYFSGSMGQVVIHNRALSAAEISTNFNLLRGRYGI